MSRRRWSIAHRLRLLFGGTAVGLVLTIGSISDWWLHRSAKDRIAALAQEELDEFRLSYAFGDRSSSGIEELGRQLQAHHLDVSIGLRVLEQTAGRLQLVEKYDPVDHFLSADVSELAFPLEGPLELGHGRLAASTTLPDGRWVDLVVDGSFVLRKLRGYEISLGVLLGLAALLGLGVAEIASRRFGQLFEEVARTTRHAATFSEETIEELLDPPDEVRDVIEALSELRRSARAEIERNRVMTAGLAHELRAPIQNLLGEAEVALIGSASNEDYRATLTDQCNLLRELADSVDNLVTLCRDGNRDPPSQLERFDLGHEARVRDRRWRQPAERQGIELDVTHDGDLSLEGDRETILRALRNLVANAINASHDGQTVEVALVGRPAEVVVVVADRGAGISEVDRERIFEPFYRGATPSGRRAGYGLGLALVRSAALQHGGTIRSEDRAGGGTLMTLTLPRQTRGRPASNSHETSP